MDDLMRELNEIRAELNKSIKLLRKSGNAAALAEKEYQIAKSEAVMRLKAEGCPATIIALIIKGQPEVSEKMFARDTARVLYATHQEHINVKKKDLSVIAEQIEREWHSG